MIAEDNDARPAFRAELKKFGYRISLAVSEEDVLDRVRTGCLKIDLTLINIPKKRLLKQYRLPETFLEKVN